MNESMSEAAAVINEESIESSTPKAGDIEPIKRSDALERAVSGVVFFLVVILPLFFGGVHEHTWYPISMIVLCLSAAYIYSRNSASIGAFSSNRGSLLAFAAGCSFIGILLIQAVWFSISSLPHPVLGSASGIHSWTLFMESSLSFLYAFALFLMARIFFRLASGSKKRFLRWTTISLVIVSVVALSQWFYDNGKLLWIFPPDYEFISNRARWPFVNSNHLGAFVLLTIFPTAVLLLERLGRFDMQEMASDSTRRVQNALLGIVGLTFTLLLGILALIGSLSRGSWGGFCLGALLLTSAYIFFPRYQPSSFPGMRLYSLRKSRYTETEAVRRGGFFRRSNLKFLAPIFLIVAFIFFFRGRSAELFEDRIVYGLLYSLEDIRLQMDSDTIGLVLSNPIFGVGFGNWEPAFFTVASPLLAGLNPEYLHSDPLQLLTECGVLVLLPIGLLIYGVITSLRNGSNVQNGRLLILGTSAAIIAFTVGSIVEFSFRIPALLSIWTMMLALLFSSCEDIEVAHESKKRRRRRSRTREDSAQSPII